MLRMVLHTMKMVLRMMRMALHTMMMVLRMIRMVHELGLRTSVKSVKSVKNVKSVMEFRKMMMAHELEL